jgi:hypothetical protein
MTTYKHIRDGEIIDSRDTTDELLISKMVAKGWLPYVDEEPEFNADTQYLTSEIVIGEDAVTKTYTVNDYSAEELAPRLTEEQTSILTQINNDVNTYINNYYDVGTQQSFTAVYVKYNTDEVKNYLNPVWDWINTIMVYYYGKKQTIVDAANITTLKAITWDFTTFDATKPDVSLQALMASLA